MSLANLPDSLIAHIASYLEYEDVCNLMETSRKNYRAIKAYKKDKMKADVLRHIEDDTDFEPNIIAENGQTAKIYFSKRFNKNETLAENVTNVLKECSYVGELNLDGCDSTSDLSKSLLETGTKIGHISAGYGTVYYTPKEFVAICRKYKGSKFHLCGFNIEIYTDETLVALIEASAEITETDHSPIDKRAKYITDRTLRAFFAKNSPLIFSIIDIHNSFTIKVVVELIKHIKNKQTKIVYYDLGTLQSDQLRNGERYFNRDTGELKNEFHIETHIYEDLVFYEISIDLGRNYNYNNEEAKVSQIVFGVLP